MLRHGGLFIRQEITSQTFTVLSKVVDFVLNETILEVKNDVGFNTKIFVKGDKLLPAFRVYFYGLWGPL